MHATSFDILHDRWLEYWNKENHIRPMISLETLRSPTRPAPTIPSDLQQRWEDPNYVIPAARWKMEYTDYWGEAILVYNPDLGPDIVGAIAGCSIEYGENTSWAVPIVEDWEEHPPLSFQPDSIWWKKISALTQAAMEDSRGDYLVGITDLHPGSDGLVSLRGPDNLCYDLIDCGELLQPRIEQLFNIYSEIYKGLSQIIAPYQQGSTNWMGIWHPEKNWYVVGSDFSCMISPDNYEQYIVPGLEMELNMLDASMYHLDGPGALRHLDRILKFPTLNGVQWVYGAGQPSARYWIEVLQRIQNSGKLIQVNCEMDDVIPICQALNPEGVHLIVHGCENADDAKILLRLAEEATTEHRRRR